MTTLRLTAIRCLCRDRGLERAKDSVVLKKVMSVKCYGSTSVSKTESRGSTPCTDANYGVWPSLVRRLVWDQEIVGSNPTTPTKYRKRGND